MQNVVAYCRVSTNKEDQLNSFQTQKEFFAEYAEKNNLNLLHIYADEGISGTKTKNRTAFNQMMKDSETLTFSLVLVKDISRLARNTVDLLQSVRKLRSLGIDMRFITANMTTLGESEFVLTIFGALAQEESANISKRTKFGKKVTAERGRVPTKCFGYNKIIGENYSMEINEEEAKTVRKIFDLYVNQGYGQLTIAKILNKSEIKSPRGYDWTQCSVKRILKNKIYAGYVINNKSEVIDFLTSKREKKCKEDWIEVENSALKIVDLEIWNKAQKISQLQVNKHKNNTPRKSNKFLFSTLIRCSECGFSFRRIKRDYQLYTRTWWACSGRNVKGADYCSDATTIEEDELIKAINDYFRNIIPDKGAFIKKLENKLRNYSDKENEIDYLEHKLQKLQKNKQKQIEMFEDDIIDIEELKTNTKELNCKISEIEYQITQRSKCSENGTTLKKFISDVDNSFDDYISVANMTNAELKKLIDKISVSATGEVSIHLKSFET